jgi:hypothetical protein
MTDVAAEKDVLTRLEEVGQVGLADLDPASFADIVANLLGGDDEQIVPVSRFGSAI